VLKNVFGVGQIPLR